jgi:hypothetical protein
VTQTVSRGAEPSEAEVPRSLAPTPPHRVGSHLGETDWQNTDRRRWDSVVMGRRSTTDGERRAIAVILASYGAPLLRFADLIASANNDDVDVHSIEGPVPGLLLEHYEMRALAVGGNSDGVVAVVGLDRLAELVDNQEPCRFTAVTFSDHRRRLDGASLLLIHDGDEVVAAVGYDGPSHPVPAVHPPR